MPKRPKRFEDYSWSHQNKLIRLDRIDSSNDDQSVHSYSSEEELNAEPFLSVQNEPGNASSIFENYSNGSASDSDEGKLPGERDPYQCEDHDDIQHQDTNDTDSNDSDSDERVSSDSDSDERVPSDSDSSEGVTSESNSNHSALNYSDNESIAQDDDHGNGDREINDNELYEGAPITVSESMTSILNLKVRHNVTDALLSDILSLVELHCPQENNCRATLYKFKKYFSDMQTPIVRHYHCGQCFTKLENRESICPICREETKDDYTIEISLLSQIRRLFKQPGFYHKLQYRFTRERQNLENYEDIYDGSFYREQFEDEGLLANSANISFTWYTDGISIFKSSKFSIWPVYLIINELTFSERMKKENILLVGLWFGEEKPAPNLFLQPLCQSLRELREGVDVDIADLNCSRLVQGIVICCTCDLPAKSLFLNMKQYNGRFGCQKCKQEGLYLNEARVRIYPYERFQLRTDVETQLHAQQAFDSGTPVCGVKGPTILSRMVEQYMRAVAVDSMHCVYEGVVKSLLSFWFAPNYVDHPSSLNQHIDLVDRRLLSLTPPSFIQRLPRSIAKHLAYWKAHELKAWFFYYALPCVGDLMKDTYLDHFKLLLLGISLLSRSSISLEDLNIASRALNEFVSRFEELYLKRNMSNNLHQLLHLVENVRQFGPLWTTSCFPLEDLNGKLKSLVHGSKSAQLQIHSAVSQYLNLTTLKTERLDEGRPAYAYCEKLDYKRGRMKRHFVSESVYIVGKCVQLELPRDITAVFERSGINGASFYRYKRLLKKKVMYSSTDNQRRQRTNSTYALYAKNNSKRIGRVRCFIRVADCLCSTLCHCDAKNYAILKPCVAANVFLTCIDNISLSMVHAIMGFENEEVAVDVENLKAVCFYSEIHDTSESYVIEPVNSVEFE